MDAQPNPNTVLQSPSPPSQPRPPLHQSDADEDDESVKQLQECSSLYLSLQDCLIKTDRNWKSCQMEVQALKACNERRKNDKRKALYEGVQSVPIRFSRFRRGSCVCF